MAVQTRDQLKQWFETGDYPTQQQFWDWIDSYVHNNDSISLSQVAGLITLLNSKLSNGALAAGDLSGTYPDPVVAKIRGVEVHTVAPTNGQVLKYVAANSRYEPGDAAGGGALDDLTDVILTTPVTGEVLKFNGTNWINGTGSSVANLDDLTDVDLTGAVNGDTLVYNGTNWVDGKIIDALLTGFVADSGSVSVLATDTIKQAFQKLAGTDAQLSLQIGTVQVGNNLFNYYNFR